MSTFLELQEEVLNYGFDPSRYRGRVKSWLNQAQSRIARKLKIGDLYVTSTITTAKGTASYTLPTALIRLTGLTMGADAYRLDYVDDPDRLVADNEAGQNTGEPTEFAVTGKSIVLSPVPDAVYSLTLTYFGRPADMVNDTDVSTLPADYHDLMVSWALERAFRSEDDAEMAQFYRNEYKLDLADAGTDLQMTVDDSPKQVPGTWS